MKPFQDNQNRTWEIEVTVDSIKRVKGLIDVDLLEVLQGELLARLGADPILLCDVLYALCKPQADEAGVSDEQFGQGMAGDAIDAATTALLGGLVDFFPKGQRSLLTKALAKLKTLEAMTQERGEKTLDGPLLERVVKEELDRSDAELEAQLRAKLDAARPTPPGKSGEQSTDSPGPPASTPAP